MKRLSMFQFPHIIFKTSAVVPKGQEKKQRKFSLECLLGSEITAPCNSDDQLGYYTSDTGKKMMCRRKKGILSSSQA